MVELMEDIKALKEEIKSDSEAITDAPPSAVERLPAPTIEAGNSAERTLQNILFHIRNASVGKIGICGMGGVGKTTVMRKLNNQPEIAQMFDIVIWVTVSKDWNLRRVQNEVAMRLKLTLSNDMSNDEVQRSLYGRLGNTKYLLLLDDVWNKVTLEQVGIPIPNEKNGCKIVLTTRSRRVCKEMETDKVVDVELLSEEAAWNLFCWKVGSVVASPEIKPLATSVVKECGGLPLAVIVVGGALREEADARVWRNALRELRSAPTSQIQGMDEEVFQRLKFSYDKLKCDRQRCFLYGALFPEDYEINTDNLIEYWRAAGFIEGAESLAEAADRGHVMIADLVEASLFEKGENEDGVFVKMHDVIRDLALKITSVGEEGGNKFLVRAGEESRDPPRAEEWKECIAVSFIDNLKLLRQLPEKVQCPGLITLLLQGRWKVAIHIPKYFFESMAALRVLDLSGTDIKSLPPSICNLVSLRALYLNGCIELVKLPPQIRALKALEVLHVHRCHQLKHLPVEVGELSHLKSLRVRSYNMLVPQGIVSRLSGLEDLSIDLYITRVNHKWWDRRDRNTEHVVKEIGNLERLAFLEILFTRVEHLESFVRVSEPWRDGTLSSFKIHLYLDPHYVSRYANVKDCCFEFVGGLNVPDVVRQVLRRTLHFELRTHGSIKKLKEFGAIKKLKELGAENSMTRLISLWCQECPEMESLIEGACPLPALQKLRLYKMPKLMNIWGEGQHLSVNLTELVLQNCHSLPNVLSHSIIQQLPNLQVIGVSNCEGIQEVINGDDNIEYHDALPKLRLLHLQRLPNLISISRKTLAWPSIEEIEIDRCDNLKSLPFGIHNTSTLKEIKCHGEWWASLQWEDDEIKTQLQTKLKLFGCQIVREAELP